MLGKINAKSIDMTEGFIPELLLRYAVPLILGDFLQQLYNTTDSIIVGNFVSKQGLAAVGQSAYIINALLGIFLGISLGATVIISQVYGSKNKEQLAISLDTIIKLTLILAVVFTVLGILLLPVFLKISGTTDDVYDDCRIYLRIYFLGISAQIVYNMFAGILRAVGDSKSPLYVLCITTAINAALDLLFITLLKIGVAGAALATILSQYVSAAILWMMIQKSPVFEKPILRRQAMDKAVIKEILKIGIPYGLQRSVVSLSNTVVNSFINQFGSGAMAGWSIWAKLDQFSITTMNNLGAAITTFTAQNIGAKKYDRLKSGTRIGLIICIGTTYIYGICFSVFSRGIVSLFNRDPEVIRYGVLILTTFFPLQPLNSVQHILAGALRARGDSTSPMAATLLCHVVIRQSYIHIVWKFFQSFQVILYGYLGTWILCGISSYIAYRLSIKKTGY